ncbi:MAG: serine hydrolase [Gemmatimonadota bacterium]|nr:MAG: serine hydrolase [Gemmatimonadota bacterium]
MIRRAGVVAVLFAFRLFAFSPALAQTETQNLEAGATTPSDKVDQLLAAWDRPGSPGLAVAVVKDGQIVHARGYGQSNLELGTPITPQSVFYLGSVSKQFVAMAIALLEQQGKLSVDDNIRKYVPELPDYGSPITIRHLIHHTSGIRDYLELMGLAGLELGYFHEDQGVIELLARQRALNFEPGDQYLYSNSGYLLLAVIVERASGQSLKQYAQEQIFDPLGMENTHFHDDYQHLIVNRASSYFPGEGGYRNFLTTFDRVGSGGVFSNVEDLFLWDQNFFHHRVGGSDVVERLHERGERNSGRQISYAFGLVIGEYRGLRVVDHGGALGGYRSDLIRFPDQDFSVIILANLSSINAGALARRVADIYLTDELELLEPAAVERPAAADSARTRAARDQLRRRIVSMDPAIYADYVGDYEIRPGLIVAVSVEEDRLMAQATGQPSVELLPESESRFFLAEEDVEVEFQRDESGSVYRILIYEGAQETAARRIELEPVTPDMLEEYEGGYYSEELDVTYKISSEDNRLLLRLRYESPTSLSVERKDVAVGNVGTLLFERDEEDRVTGFSLSSGRVRNVKFERS